jgi:hypothetical protein
MGDGEILFRMSQCKLRAAAWPLGLAALRKGDNDRGVFVVPHSKSGLKK